MSDQSHGAGWWLASDGRWYPPEQHPAAAPPAQPAVVAQPQVAQQPQPPGPGWWLASDGRWYPPEQHPSAPPRQPTSPAAPLPTFGAGPAGQFGPGPAGQFGAAGTGTPFGATGFTTSPAGQFGPAGQFATMAPPASTTAKRRPGFRSRPFLVAAIVVALIAAGTGVVLTDHSSPVASPTTSTPATPAATGPLMGTLDILGGPVAAGGRAIVIDVTPDLHMELSAVDPANSRVAWQQPFSASAITPGEPFTPTVIDGVVIDLAPTGAPTDPAVSIEGLDATTGVVRWTYPETGIALDAPATCGGAGMACLSWESATSTSSSLIELDATTGKLVRSIPNVERELGTDLYQTQSTTPTLVQLGSQGQVAWQRPAAAVFGPTNDVPDQGWNIDSIGSLDVGSLGSAPTGNVVDLGSSTTTGFSAATGTPTWTDPGLYNCMGPLEFLSTPVLCRFSGTEKAPSTPNGTPTFSGLGLQLNGFNPQTGAITWSQPDTNVEPMMGSGAIPFLDDDHIVVQQHGSSMVLDTKTGAVAPARAGQVFWCATTPAINVAVPAGSGYPGQRTATDRFSGCTADGTATTGSHPANQPSAVGITVDGTFLWPGPHGLRSERAA